MSWTIKFRAWDKPSKLMRFAKLIGFNLAWDFDKPELFSGKDKNFELMQYTCLKDKQGKEIYEGDIVRTTY